MDWLTPGGRRPARRTRISPQSARRLRRTPAGRAGASDAAVRLEPHWCYHREASEHPGAAATGCSSGPGRWAHFGGRMASPGPGRGARLGRVVADAGDGPHRALSLAVAGCVVVAAALTVSSSEPVRAGWATIGDNRTTTPIKHVVVLFQENVPFDRYFGVYPHALNPPGEPRFDPGPGTPMVKGLTPDAADGEPECGRPAPPRPNPAQHLRVQSRVHRGATGRGSGPHGPLRSGDRQPRSRLRLDARHGLLRRQHRDGFVDLRPALRHQRQLLRHHVRSVAPRRPEPGVGSDARRRSQQTDRSGRGRHDDRECGAGVRGLPWRGPHGRDDRPEHRGPAR